MRGVGKKEGDSDENKTTWNTWMFFPCSRKELQGLVDALERLGDCRATDRIVDSRETRF